MSTRACLYIPKRAPWGLVDLGVDNPKQAFKLYYVQRVFSLWDDAEQFIAEPPPPPPLVAILRFVRGLMLDSNDLP